MLRVNSYHHQGIRELAPRFQPMAYAKDGLIEAYLRSEGRFLVGLQFHPERMLEEPAGNWHIWKAFGAAIHRAARKNPSRWNKTYSVARLSPVSNAKQIPRSARDDKTRARTGVP